MILKKTKVAIVGEDWDVIDLIETISNLEVAGLIAPTVVHKEDIAYLGKDEDWKEPKDIKVVLAVDLPTVRAQLFQKYQNAIMSLFSREAYISPRALLQEGCIVQRGATIMAHVKVGLGCKININATIHHDCQIGNFCTIAPGALILGNVVIEDRAYIGAGAIIKQRCRIGAGAIVGAGAVVVKDVPSQKTVIGIPAKFQLK